MAAVDSFGSLNDAWERHAAQWERWTRAAGHDVYYEQLNCAAFHALVPPAGRRTLDVGCGAGLQGRVGLAGIDSSPTLVTLAREAGGYDELVCGDAAELPWEADSFDLAVAFMSMHDIDGLTDTVAEIARVLEPGERFCLAIVHPLNRAPERCCRDGRWRKPAGLLPACDATYTTLRVAERGRQGVGARRSRADRRRRLRPPSESTGGSGVSVPAWVAVVCERRGEDLFAVGLKP